MVIKSYSKINLFLKVNRKAKNGLHEIQSLFCLINLFDLIKIKKNKKNLFKCTKLFKKKTVRKKQNKHKT